MAAMAAMAMAMAVAEEAAATRVVATVAERMKRVGGAAGGVTFYIKYEIWPKVTPSPIPPKTKKRVKQAPSKAFSLFAERGLCFKNFLVCVCAFNINLANSPPPAGLCDRDQCLLSTPEPRGVKSERDF